MHPRLPTINIAQTRGYLMVDIAGVTLSAEDREVIADPRVGSVILFSRNYIAGGVKTVTVGEPTTAHNPYRKSAPHPALTNSIDSINIHEAKSALIALCEAIHTLRPDIKIAVDHEGGRVQRFRKGFTEIPPMRSLGALYAKNPATALSAATTFGNILAEELIAIGIDFSFAPVLDIDYGHSDIIGNRAFSDNANTIIPIATAFVEGLHHGGMPAIGKHFPGHGFVAADSHTDLPIDNRTWQEVSASDLLPFCAHRTIGLDGMMLAHIVFPAIDSECVGYSKRWINLLRQELDFQGMIFSDDLSMAGANIEGGIVAKCQQALSAGCEVLIICNDRSAVLEYLSH